MENHIVIHEEGVEQLKSQGCSSDDWTKLFIKPTTDLSKIKNAIFSGENYISDISGSRVFYGGVKKINVIENVHLHNCRVGNNPFISNVKSYIANYHIGDNVLIYNVGIIAVDEECYFGNGVAVNVMDEGGSREVKIFNKLSAQVGYLLAFYRHKSNFISKLRGMADNYIESVVSSIGKIGDNVKILNTNTIKGVCIGDGTSIKSAAKLLNGSINSENDAAVYIGTDVKAINFIISSDSSVDNSSILSNCFIGQGCKIDKHYSIDHCVFFANSQGYNGEACSIYAGPYTVTHHKSTLLIAGMFSFMNAGSGSNQSNHMYKLGPIHQGVMERGAKTTSDSYVLWPSKIGPFTLVMGRHYHHVDSSDFPFSYLIEIKDQSYLVPGANLKSVGTVRDFYKWPKRDNRSEGHKLDLINFSLLSPYTIHKVCNGLRHLEDIVRNFGIQQEYHFNDMTIKSSSLKKGIKLYTIAINKFLGNAILQRVDGKDINTMEELRAVLKPKSNEGLGKWLDISGMLCPANKMKNFIDRVENFDITSVEGVISEMTQMDENYHEYKWEWSCDLIERFYDVKLEKITKSQLIIMVKKWINSVVELDKLLYQDASKEFDLHTHIGFGTDDEEDKIADYENLKQVFDSNSTVVYLVGHMERKKALSERLIDKINDLK